MSVNVAPAEISTVPKFWKVVLAMLPETVTLPPAANRPVIVPVPESRSNVPPAPSTAPTKLEPAPTLSTSVASANCTDAPTLLMIVPKLVTVPAERMLMPYWPSISAVVWPAAPLVTDPPSSIE